MLENGRQIGPYMVVRLLGKGGMAEVYEVENERLLARLLHPRIGRMVAAIEGV